MKGPGVFYRAEIFWRVRRNRAWHLRWDLAQAVSLAQGLWGVPGALPPRLVARIWVARQPRQFPLVLPGCSLPSLRTPPCPSWSSPSLLAVTCPGTCVPRDAYGGGDTRGWGVQLEGAWVHAGIPKHRGDPAKGDMGLNPCWGRAHIFLGEGALRRSAVIFTGRGTASGQGCRRGAFFGEGGDGGIPAGGRAGGGDDTGGGRGSLGDSATWCRIGPARFSPN